MKCKRCNANNYGQNYCSNCLKFGKFSNEPIQYIKRTQNISNVVWKYQLTKEQEIASNKIIKSKKDVLVNAVCGAGKTEIVVKEIANFLFKQKRVGVVIPRVQLAKEFYWKLKNFFPNNSIVLVCGKSLPKLADIVVLTCHKSYLFMNQLDLVILDEVDAFPLSDCYVLQSICFNLARLKTIFLSATPPDYLPPNLLHININSRFHGKPLPLPKIVTSASIKNTLNKILLKQKKPLFVYFPTIKMQKEYLSFFNDHFNIELLNSKTPNKNEILNNFRKNIVPIIFTTSVLERGVTFKALDVIVVNANHLLFNKEVLIQICGRVGRKLFYEKGNIILLSNSNSRKLKAVIKEIENKNKMPSM